MHRKTCIQSIKHVEDDADHGYDRPSKSRRKHQMHVLQQLGRNLVELPKDALKRMSMPEDLDDAVREARRITDHKGKRRQMQYIGKVMRSLTEPEIEVLRTALDTQRGVNKAATARLHWIERTRAQLLVDDEALTRFIRDYPVADVQEGRTLIRNTRKEAQLGKPSRHFRELFQWINTARGKLSEDAAGKGEHDDES
ncbi:MAG: ribosome biogenesis factor YjgA [Burkholderia sp.]|nr:MAG: hypothetical protein E5299_01150 [Burkholderia gladioli]